MSKYEILDYPNIQTKRNQPLWNVYEWVWASVGGSGPSHQSAVFGLQRPNSTNPTNNPTRPLFCPEPATTTHLPACLTNYLPKYLTHPYPINFFLHKAPKAPLTLIFYNHFCLQLKWKLARVFAQGLLSLYNVQNRKRAFCPKSICSGILKGFHSLSKPH